MKEINSNPYYGKLTIDQLFTADDLGISLPEPHLEHALNIFLELSTDDEKTAIAPRVIRMHKGMLFLQSLEGVPNSGAIYLYERATGAFFLVQVEIGENLTVRDFDELVEAYGLRDWAACPERIPPHARVIGRA